MVGIKLVDTGRTFQLSRIKKIIIASTMLFLGAASLVTLSPEPASAAQCKSDTDSNFLSFPTWYRNLCDGSGELHIGQGSKPIDTVLIIALNVIDIALRLIGIVVVGLIIYGGFRYVNSRGSPDETKKAQETILKALVGLVITMAAAGIVTYVVSGLGK